MDPANKSPLPGGNQSTAYLGLLLAPARLPSNPIPLLWGGQEWSSWQGALEEYPALADSFYPHPLHLSFFRGQISLEPKQCEQLNARSRTKFKKCLSHCCTERFHFLMSLTCWPLFSWHACLPPLAAQLAACWVCVCVWGGLSSQADSFRATFHKKSMEGQVCVWD